MSRKDQWALFLTTCVFVVLRLVASEAKWDELNLPEEHMPYFFHNNPLLREHCLLDQECPYHESAGNTRCWGFEETCPIEDRMLYPQCYEEVKSLRAWQERYKANSQEEVYWKQADFGFLQERLQEMTTYCEPQEPDDSSLECSKNFRLCKATNIYMDFRRHEFRESNRYAEDVFEPGEIGGHCKLYSSELKKQDEHKSPLQSWYAELQHYTSLESPPINNNKCDIVIEKPTILIKLDAGVNMYHHFCDYLNLYLSQHGINDFSQDIQIINWDTSHLNYGDFFSETWKVFSDHPVKYLREFEDKRVCFKNVLFPLLARMRFGLFYNTPLIGGCKDTVLFRAFQQHVLHRLGVLQNGPLKTKIRVTLLTRGTKFRKMLNEPEIVAALSEIEDYEFKVVNYNHTVPFKEQLSMSMNSDIFMGMHGSGLTHLLFQPDWGAIFEIYNCDDVHCYQDLAHLRGLRYFTWENTDHLIQEDEGHHPTLGAHKKFTNYTFDVNEFLRIVRKMANYVKQHPSFRSARRQKYDEAGTETDQVTKKTEL